MSLSSPQEVKSRQHRWETWYNLFCNEKFLSACFSPPSWRFGLEWLWGPPNSDIRGLRPCPVYQEWQVVGHGCRLGRARAFTDEWDLRVDHSLNA